MIIVENKEHWITQIELLQNTNEVFCFTKSNKYSYREIFSFVKKSVSYFRQKGINVNDHVSIISENNLDFIVAINALWLIGAIPIPLNIKQTEIELKKLVIHSKSKFIIDINNVLKCDLSIKEIKYAIANIEPINESNNFVIFDSSALALLMYTSGSTGVQKGVQLTFNNLYLSAKSADGLINHNINDRWLVSLPFNHIGGFSILVRSMLSGCSLIFPNTLKQQDLTKCINEYLPSLISLVPTMLFNLLTSGLSTWNNLRFLFLGGAPANNKLINSAIKKDFPICLVYGSTETSSMVTACNTEQLKLNGISAGIPLKNVGIILLDSNGKEVEKNCAGRVAINSGSVALKYFNPTGNESKNFINNMFISNDIGKIDLNGNLNIIDRIDDIIISGGENISLSEIENLLLDEYNIEDCVALEVADEKWGQSYILVIKSVINSEVLIGNVKEFLKIKLADFKQPQKIIQVKDIPRNELGKINKNELRTKLKLNVH